MFPSKKADVLKMTNNAFHAVKVGFANEIGKVGSRLGIDSHVVTGWLVLTRSPTFRRLI